MRRTHGTCARYSLPTCHRRTYPCSMTSARTALVTGANQGLGRALVEALAAGMGREDRVLLTGRDPERVRAAAAAAPATGARVEGRVLDVRDAGAIDALAHELGEVDIVFSNATARMSPQADPADEVDAVAQTSNVATSRMLRAFAPRLRPGGRLIVVASALGTLDKLDAPVRPRPPATPATPPPRAGRGCAPAGGGPAPGAAPVAGGRAAVPPRRAEQEGFGT